MGGSACSYDKNCDFYKAIAGEREKGGGEEREGKKEEKQIYIYIYIYIQRQRERERERDFERMLSSQKSSIRRLQVYFNDENNAIHNFKTTLL